MKKTVVDQMMTDGSYATRAEADRAYEHVFMAMRAVLERGEKVTITNFGAFRRKFREGRVGRNPRTGEQFNIPGRYVITFKQSQTRG